MAPENRGFLYQTQWFPKQQWLCMLDFPGVVVLPDVHISRWPKTGTSPIWDKVLRWNFQPRPRGHIHLQAIASRAGKLVETNTVWVRIGLFSQTRSCSFEPWKTEAGTPQKAWRHGGKFRSCQSLPLSPHAKNEAGWELALLQRRVV